MRTRRMILAAACAVTLEALAAGACRVLEGKEQMKVFDSYGANA